MSVIKAWSFSSLIEYEKCPYKMKLRYVDGIKIPPPTEPDHPLNRGNRCHQLIENHIQFGGDLTNECQAHFEYLKPIREAYTAGNAIVEDEWGYDLDWNMVPWSNATCRMKLDAMVIEPDAIHIYDWKTGKRSGNEIKHTHQGQLYAVGGLARFPNTENFKVTFRYLDTGQDITLKYKPAQIERFRETFNRRAMKMLTDEQLRAIPNKGNCKFCDYAPHCPFAVE